jgi:hypothetical protein
VKILVVIGDAARLETLRQDLVELGSPGYTVMPVLEGAGRTGLHAGDRVHPGGLVALFTIVDDARADPLLTDLVARRDRAGDRVTRMFLMPVERME